MPRLQKPERLLVVQGQGIRAGEDEAVTALARRRSPTHALCVRRGAVAGSVAARKRRGLLSEIGKFGWSAPCI